ncbi:MAG TPA: hypothetical protein VE377_09515 [Candidatus Dormibacteraeota bacterium]|nr:hypothetical protein [Candidatus Dormibacteraeota bacterium]
MRRWIRLAWIGLTNSLLVLTPVYFLPFAMPHGLPGYAVFYFIAYWWDFIFGAVLGFVLDAVQAKSAQVVNVGIWLWIALKSAAIYFNLWGRFAGDNKWLAAYLTPIALTIAAVNFFLYRKKGEMEPTTTLGD